MSTTEMNDVFAPTLAPGSSVRLPMNPSTGAVMTVLARVDLQLVEAGLGLFHLRHRELELRLRRLVARVGVVERLPWQQVALEEALRAFHVVLRELQIGLALANGRLRHVVRRLCLLDLLDDLAVLDLRNRLTAANGIAQLDVDRVETPLTARHRVDRCRADRLPTTVMVSIMSLRVTGASSTVIGGRGPRRHPAAKPASAKAAATAATGILTPLRSRRLTALCGRCRGAAHEVIHRSSACQRRRAAG